MAVASVSQAGIVGRHHEEPDQLYVETRELRVQGFLLFMVSDLVLFSSFSSAIDGEIPMPGPFDTNVALHALVAAGYDDEKTIAHFDPTTGRTAISGGALRVRNSWGTQWGDGGYGWLPYDYVRAGLTSDWWCLVRADYLDIGTFSPQSAALGGSP